MNEVAQEISRLVIDGTKVGFWRERVEAWHRGERIAPITMDIAWTRRCNAACDFCAAKTQASASPSLDIPREKAFEFLDDAAQIGVKGIDYARGDRWTEDVEAACREVGAELRFTRAPKQSVTEVIRRTMALPA